MHYSANETRVQRRHIRRLALFQESRLYQFTCGDEHVAKIISYVVPLAKNSCGPSNSERLKREASFRWTGNQ